MWVLRILPLAICKVNLAVIHREDEGLSWKEKRSGVNPSIIIFPAHRNQRGGQGVKRTLG